MEAAGKGTVVNAFGTRSVAVVGDLMLGIPFWTFLERIKDVVPVHDLWVGAQIPPAAIEDTPPMIHKELEKILRRNMFGKR